MSEVDDVLAHYGVKGMRWGQRRAHLNSTDYGSRDKIRDTSAYGTRGAKRIESRVAAGKTIKQARRREFGRQTGQVALGAASVIALLNAPSVAQHAAQSLTNKRQLKAEDWANLQKILDKTALTSYKTIVL